MPALLRRRFSVEFKLSLVKASQEPGASIAAVAINNGINPNLLQRWLKESDAGVVWRGSGRGDGVRYPAQYKRSIVEQCLRPGGTMSHIALSNGLSPKVVQHWVRQARKEQVPEFFPIQVREDNTTTQLIEQAGTDHALILEAPLPAPEPVPETPLGQIEIELGGARLLLKGAVDHAALRVVLESLRS